MSNQNRSQVIENNVFRGLYACFINNKYPRAVNTSQTPEMLPEIAPDDSDLGNIIIISDNRVKSLLKFSYDLEREGEDKYE